MRVCVRVCVCVCVSVLRRNLYNPVFPDDYAEWVRQQGVQLLRLHTQGNKLTPTDMNTDEVVRALQAILDKRNHPVLIHCRSGKVGPVPCWADGVQRAVLTCTDGCPRPRRCSIVPER